MAEKMLYTEEGYKVLVDELNYLKTTKRDEIKEAIALAKSFGDLSENSEYDEARNEQAKTEARIKELEELVANAQIVDESKIDMGVVSLGSTVTVYDVEEDEEIVYSIGGDGNKIQLLQIGRFQFCQNLHVVVELCCVLGSAEVAVDGFGPFVPGHGIILAGNIQCQQFRAGVHIQRNKGIIGIQVHLHETKGIQRGSGPAAMEYTCFALPHIACTVPTGNAGFHRNCSEAASLSRSVQNRLKVAGYLVVEIGFS